MGRPPAVILIVRHGSRLDAVDKQWHHSSSTPYDPPLSYGGWLQSRALGARIAGLLEARENEVDDSRPQILNGSVATDNSSTCASCEADSTGNIKTQKTGRRKHKVVIHTSPFLRCLQTSIGISAGMSQYRGASAASKSSDSKSSSTSDVSSSTTSPSVSKPIDGSTSLPTDKDNEKGEQVSAKNDHRILLRVDAFLGEWLSPDYYDQIMPPPDSILMVTGAKAELLRRGEDIPRHDGHTKSISGHFPGGWGSSSTPMSPEEDGKDQTRYNSAMSFALGQRHRAGSYDGPFNLASIGRGLLPRLSTETDISARHGYVPPTPTYAVSTSEPIPPGYVAHARDACVDVDYQWDSMREPYNWGDGGQYGEEWSSMHIRFRNGLQKMVDWYRTHHSVEWERRGPRCEKHAADIDTVTDDEDDADTVLVLVTHGAGCNALIGALTNEPVLLDVGMASLTMALYKGPSLAAGVSEATTPPTDVSLSQEYDIKIIASTDHLRAAPTAAAPQRPSSPKVSVSVPAVPSHRPRVGSRPSTKIDTAMIGDAATRSSNSQRASSTESRQSPLSRGPSGLWASASANDGASQPGDDIAPNSGDSKPASSNKTQPNREADVKGGKEGTWSQRIPERTKSQRGLWGSAPMINEGEPSLKRRWTVTERRR
ncbi:phosphoglycerate mutase family protein [Paecilomyces variotii No. 5]|uniref:Phosphoglycerate mutase family protein n=1 Tax=Byssochlamys spectabilis (strain No. 5 / NBRC 109023) TaxID=1356009 RepID=V5FM16_BYSSN|nr:phosphoglycerate mutase family protein [Paecilomyces variotii No. 5]